MTRCPLSTISAEQAKEEIERMINSQGTEDRDITCLRCGYCNVICPAKANPTDLRKEILVRKSSTKGVQSLRLMCRETPMNLMNIALDFETKEKHKLLSEWENPPVSETVFYLGCSVSCLHTDLAGTALLDGLPVVGGIKYCCGDYVRTSFGEEEAAIKGRALLQEFNRTGIRKIITFCPNCDAMMRTVYPKIIPEFAIEVQNISEYLLEKHRAGALPFTHTINKKIAFHDPCGWRSVDEEVYEAPRKLLEAMGATVVEMKHNRRRSLCCGSPKGKTPLLADQLAENRVLEAREAGADAIAVACTGCYSLSQKAAEHGMDVLNITELCQMGIGEKPKHRIIEVRDRLILDIMQRMPDSPELFQKRYVLKQGKVETLDPTSKEGSL